MARILVAEDDQFTREMVQRALEADGHEVVVAEDGGEALGLVHGGQSFDLVLTDVEMPNLTGLELTEQLIGKNTGQRVIIMSGIADELARASSLIGPTVRMITKPVTLEKLKSEVASLLA